MEFVNLEVEDYPQLLKIYNEAFPEDERRAYEDEKDLERFIGEHHVKFHGFSVKDGDLYLGFLTYWTFKDYVYVEHFALAPQYRGKNIGRKMLHHLFEEVSQNVLIEVEHPDTEEAQRRIKFYEQNGFRLRGEFEYIQPPYSEGKQAVPMQLMTHGEVNLKSKEDIREMLREVYNVNN